MRRHSILRLGGTLGSRKEGRVGGKVSDVVGLRMKIRSAFK